MNPAAAGSVSATPFRWHDGERVIVFGHARSERLL